MNNFTGNFGGDCVEGNKYTSRPDGPSLDHPNAIECPQCWKTTWRGTQKCVHCEYDVWLHFEELGKKKRKEVLKKRVIFLYILASGLLLLGYCSVNYFSSSMAAVLFIAAFFVFALGAKLDSII